MFNEKFVDFDSIPTTAVRTFHPKIPLHTIPSRRPLILMSGEIEDFKYSLKEDVIRTLRHGGDDSSRCTERNPLWRVTGRAPKIAKRRLGSLTDVNRPLGEIPSALKRE